MAELVDSIVADLEIRYQQYVDGFAKATTAVDRHTKALGRLAAADRAAGNVGTGIPAATAKDAVAAEAASEKRKRAAKGASDTEKAEAKVAADAVKKAAREREQAERAAARASEAATKAAEREKQAVLKATQREQEKAAKAAAAKAEAERIASAAAVAAAEREAAARVRLAEVAQRAVDRRSAGIAPAVGGRIGATVPREATSQRSIPLNVLNGDARAEVEAEKEINHLLADQAVLSSRLGILKGRERDYIRDQVSELRLVRQLERAGLDDAAIAVKLEERRALIARQRRISDAKQSDAGVASFAKGAGLNRIGGGGAAIAGIATAVGVGVGIEVIQSAVEYGKALDDLSKQLGITIEDLQAYLKLARDTGVEQATLSSAFGQFASNLGRAQQGQEEYSKVFKALGVDIKTFSTAGDALPTIIERISSIADPLQRAAVETRLFGEEGRKLDPLLSGGAERVAQLSRSLQETGKALSQEEIQELGETARKLGEVKNQLSVDFARVVSGNSDAIIGLANSFGTLAGSVIGAIGSIQRFNAQKLNDLGGGQTPVAPGFIARIQTGAENLFRRAIGAGARQVRSAAPAIETSTPAEAAFLASLRRPTAPVQAGRVNAGLLRNLGAPKPSKGKSADQTAREEEQRSRQFNDQLAQATAGYLRAQEQLTGSADKRAEIELELLDTASKARIADIESQRKRNVLAGADAGTEAARAAELTAAERRARNEDALVIEQERRFAKERALTTATSSLLDARAMVLSAELSLARTNAERRRKQFELVDNQEQQDRNRLNGVIASSPADSPEAQQARVDLEGLAERSEVQRRVIRDQTLDPLDQYKKDLHSATDDTSAALQSIEVNALQSLEDSLSRSIGKVLGLKGAFGDLAGSVLTDIARLELKKGILSFLNSGGDGGGTGGLIASIGRAVGLGGTRAVGGNVVGGVPYLVGERGPEPVVFGQSGRVYPNGSLPSFGGGGHSNTVTVHQSFHADMRGAMTFPEFVAEFKGYVDTQAKRAGSAAVIASAKSMPGTLAKYGDLQG